MKIKVENLGNIEKAELEIGNLTILTGKNNTGKTYIAYALYGFLDSWLLGLNMGKIQYNQEETNNHFIMTFNVKEIINNSIGYLNNMVLEYNKNVLHEIFNVSKTFFKSAKFDFSLPNFDKEIVKQNSRKLNKKAFKFLDDNLMAMYVKKDMFSVDFFHSENNQGISSLLFKEVLFELYIPYATYIITAERTGIHLFQKGLDNYNDDILKKFGRKFGSITGRDWVNVQKLTSHYSTPISDNITFARNKEKHLKNDSDIAENDKELLQEIEELLGVGYNFQEGSAYLKLDNEQALPLYMASTSARALLDLYIHIRHILKKNDLLIIDEPELNLHPEMQMKVARVFAKLVRSGVKILITTHSDYIVKEINNLITLSNDFETKSDLMKRYNYKENEILQPSDVKAYIASDKTLHQVKIDNWGMEKTTFDESIDLLNEISEEIIYGINQ